jgi:hypothetical protein
MRTSARLLFAAGGVATLTCALLLGPGRSVAQSGENVCFGQGKLCTRTTVITCEPDGSCSSTVSYTFYN